MFDPDVNYNGFGSKDECAILTVVNCAIRWLQKQTLEPPAMPVAYASFQVCSSSEKQNMHDVSKKNQSAALVLPGVRSESHHSIFPSEIRREKRKRDERNVAKKKKTV